MSTEHYRRCARCRRENPQCASVGVGCASRGETQPLSAAEKVTARKLFDGEIKDREGTTVKTACVYCGGLHDGPGAPLPTLRPDQQPCPRIKRIERHADGTVLVLEFFEPGTWEYGTVFPRDVYDDLEDDQPRGEER